MMIRKNSKLYSNVVKAFRSINFESFSPILKNSSFLTKQYHSFNQNSEYINEKRLISFSNLTNKNIFNSIVRRKEKNILIKNSHFSYITNAQSKSFSNKTQNNKTKKKDDKSSKINNTLDKKNKEKILNNTTLFKENLNSQTLEINKIKYNPEILDKQSNLFNLTDKLPDKIQHFIKLGRYDRPIGYMLLFYPCAWGLTLSTHSLGFDYLYYSLLFLSGSILMRSSGCIINDMWDRNIDKMVERSKMRPLAAGFLTMKEASVFLSVHLALSLIILLKLPTISIITGLGIMPIVCIYPYMKRITYLPQIFLGLCFNCGVLVGYPVFQELFDLNIILPFYLGGILWTLIYDTIYAHMDKLDDSKINVKSSALYFGNNSKLYFYVMNFLMILCFYLGLKNYSRKNIEKKSISNEGEHFQNNKNSDRIEETGFMKINGSKVIVNQESEFDIKENYFRIDPSYLFLGLGYIFQVYLIKTVNLNDPLSCLKAFKRNSFFGLIILASCLFKVCEKNIKEKAHEKLL